MFELVIKFVPSLTMPTCRETLLLMLHTTITIISGFVTLVQQDPRLRTVNVPDITDKLRSITLYVIRIQTWVQICGPWLDHLLTFIYYSTNLLLLTILVYCFNNFIEVIIF